MRKRKGRQAIRQAIGNKIYDTETSTLLAYDHNFALDMNAHTETALYRSPKGQYFKYEFTDAFMESVPLDPKITLLDTDEAIALFNKLTQDCDFKDAFPSVEFTEG